MKSRGAPMAPDSIVFCLVSFEGPDAYAQVKAEGFRVVFPIRGGIEAHGQEVLARARALGLHVADIDGRALRR